MERSFPSGDTICIHAAILQRCLRDPEGVAVDSWDGSITYYQLDLLSANLAGRLACLGVAPETLVRLCFKKSKWAIVAVLGVIRAGGAYAFLDPSYPAARMTSIAKILRLSILFAQLPALIYGLRMTYTL
jgi:non-ribosomal peptide synthetase component F